MLVYFKPFSILHNSLIALNKIYTINKVIFRRKSKLREGFVI